MLLAIIRRDLKEELSRPAGLILQLCGTAAQALFWAMMGRALGGDDYLQFVALGGAVLNFLNGPLLALASGLSRERQLGTLDFFIQSGRRPLLWGLAFCAFPTLWSGLLTVLFLAIMVLNGLPVSAAGAACFAVALLAGLPVYLGGALLCGAWTVRFRRGQPLALLLGFYSMLFGGIFIKVERLPAWGAKLSAFAPTLYPAMLARSAWLGAELPLRTLGGLLLIGAAVMVAGALCFEWSVGWLRQSGDYAAD
jgi:ABC-type polysaccharide/polyol phosphate export permease